VVTETGVAQNGGETRSTVRWHEIAQSEDFRRLESTRRRAGLLTLTIFALAFGVFLVLSGYARPFMRKSVDGGLTVAYVWILALTVLAWVLVWSYLRVAGRLETMAHEMLQSQGYGEERR
jgi:uncharacterized membrane protein (DUF485 family)